jgi:lambda family phage tail tape measure protein
MPYTDPAADGFARQVSTLTTDFTDATRNAALLGKTVTSAFESIAFKGKGLGDVFNTLALSLAKSTLSAAFQPLQSNLGSIFSSLFTGGVTPFARGGALQSGMPIPFAQGGVVASPMSFPLANGRTGLMGERGAEAIMPLTRGPDGRLGVAASGGSAPRITVNISTPDVESFRRSETQMAALLARAVAQGHRNL